MPNNRLVVLVNGLPGAGKSTLAYPLAQELGLPLLSKDLIKETWADVLGSLPPDGRTQQEWNALFGAAASQTMWNLVARSPCGGVVDSPLPARVRWHAQAGLAAAGVIRPLEVWCDVPAEVSRARQEARRRTRHPIHGAMGTPPADAGEDEQPLGLGPVLRVDTTRPVDVIEVATWCRAESAKRP